MADDYSHFKGTFLTECLELLAQMEELLLRLDEGEQGSDLLNAIFRCAHSIKGGAGALGFKAIAGFTHTLEALLDEMREGRVTPSRESVDVLLKARDVLLRMVADARENKQTRENYGAPVAEQLKALVAKPGDSAAGKQAANAPPAVASAGKSVYRIAFSPQRQMLEHGNEPLLLIRELKKLGACSIHCNSAALPPIDDIDPTGLYLSWVIELTTESDERAIREVFEFVEDECTLEISRQALEQEQQADQSVVFGRRATDLLETPPAVQAATSIRVDIDKVDRLINMVGEVVIIQAMLAMQSRFLPVQQYAELIRGVEELNQQTRELQEAVMAIRMQPVKSIFARMPRIVRDIAATQEKNVKLETRGETTEVDKTIIEQLADPLTHMIRNAVDHGIEKPAARTASGKSEQGTIILSADNRGGKIVIEIKDDGHGINREKVLKKAREKGLVTAQVEPTAAEIDQLIFRPGFSTAEVVTDVSGRGVGMDVVKRNIESIGGTVILHNAPGQGSHFVIELPLTLAILDGMVVRVAGENYIVPIASIIETLRPAPGDVRGMADGGHVMNVRGVFTPVLFLHALFGVRNAVNDASQGLIILVESGDTRVGLVVDELIGQQQVVIKTLEDNTDPIEGVSGATILGDGKVSLILDVAALSRTGSKYTSKSNPKAA